MYIINKLFFPIQSYKLDSVTELCKMRDGVLFSDLSKRDIFLGGKMIFIVCEQKKSIKKYKQMLYATYIIIYKIQKYRINTHIIKHSGVSVMLEK